MNKEDRDNILRKVLQHNHEDPQSSSISEKINIIQNVIKPSKRLIRL